MESHMNELRGDSVVVSFIGFERSEEEEEVSRFFPTAHTTLKVK